MNAALKRNAAERLVAQATFHWHQRFALAPGFYAPGDNDVERLFAVAQVPDDLSGLSVLDVGTSNGGVCFEAERRGAARVIGADIAPIEHCGFDSLRNLLGSSAEFVQASIYVLPEVLAGEQFDLVIFWGVLYHLRHPLLALDSLRRLVRGVALLETAVCDAELPRRASRDFRSCASTVGNELDGDASNWFAPTTRALLDWCGSSGFESTLLGAWPPPINRVRALSVADRLSAWARRSSYEPVPRLTAPGDSSAQRAMVRLEPAAGEPEYTRELGGRSAERSRLVGTI